MTFVNASVESMYGRVASAWKIANGKFTLNVDVPPNTMATVRLPKAKLEQVTEGEKPLTGRSDLLGTRQVGDAVLVDVGSGSYQFVVLGP